MTARPQQRQAGVTRVNQVVTALADEIGPRPATSAAEARAAAIVAAQMRQCGLDVSVQTFAAAAAPSLGLGLLAAVGMLAAALGWLAPWPSLALGLLAWAVAIWELRGPPRLAAMLRREPSQNVVGTRAAEGPPAKRVVLLCHLDSPRIVTRRWFPYLRWKLLSVPVSLGLLNVGLLLVALGWLPTLALLLPLVALALVTLLILLRERQAVWSAGAVDAAAAGVALATSLELRAATDLELWVIGLGAGAAAGAGIHALLQTYPFDPAETLFINLPWLGRGTLTLVAGEGLWREQAPDSELVDLFHELRSFSTQLARRPYRGERLDSARLLKLGYRAVSLVGLRADGRAAGFRQADDLPEYLDSAQLAAVIRLLARGIQRISALH